MMVSARLLLLVSLAFQVTGFCVQPTFLTSHTHGRCLNVLSEGANSDTDATNSDQSNGAFSLEEVALKGADKIRKLSIEERTQRAMIAEAVEDRMVVLHDKLDLMLGNGKMPLDDEDKQKVQGLAMQIKVLQDEYTELVSGEKSRWIQSTDSKESD
mmetsp:Transcript_26370/g.38213  ORF Transcript_26370/g.38213 Transcript_26370/m.38213 type:complete len:156 (-) Transcript_26370:265-732(-)